MEYMCTVCGASLSKPKSVYCGRKCTNVVMTNRSAAAARKRALERGRHADVIKGVAHLSLSAGEIVKIDIDDLTYLSQWTWGVSDSGYATRMRTRANGNNRSPFRMHREIMERALGRQLRKSELVDHRNLDRLDNRKINLRLATASQNAHNYGKYATGTSKYKGVCWDKLRKKWRVEIKADGKQIMVGRFSDEDTAAWMRDQWCLALHGDFAVLNFEYVGQGWSDGAVARAI